jgi:hypothetical protein
MATNHDNHDPLRNPQVDYDRSDLSPSGILYFLIGLLIVGVFIELVVWGMFRFMAHSEVLFAQGQQHPMATQGLPPTGAPASVLQNTPGVNLSVFPEPRLQTNDAGEMSSYLTAEQELLNPKQPFTDPSGAVHIPVSMAMQLIAERGLPVRPKAPPADLSSPGADAPKVSNALPAALPPGNTGAGSAKAPGSE